MAGEGISSRTRSQKGRKETKKPRQSRKYAKQEKAGTRNHRDFIKDLRNEVSEVKAGIKELRVSMNKLTTYIENTSPITARQNESPIPLSISTMQTPKNSSVSEKTDKAYGDKEFLIGKRLFQTFNDDTTSIYYLNNEPLNTHRYDGRTVEVPADMVLDDLEASIAAYIFWVNHDDPIDYGDEILISSSWGDAKRFMLNCLNPGARIISEVLNQLANRLTDIERSVDSYFIAWILPTTFSLNVLERGASATRMRTCLKNKFIFQADNLRNVFTAQILVPINDENEHRYLLVVNMFERKLTILDFFPTKDRKEWRRRNVKKLEIFLEEILDDPLLYDNENNFRSKQVISEFTLHEPDNLPKQDPTSNDCGIWVALWMTHCIWNIDYDKIQVTEDSRMRIVVDLVLHDYNNVKKLIVSKASDNWVRLNKNWRAT
ncbi:Ulp1 protease family, C-terminal catalytic domain [Sesbania bispinosa]|nr:Ulp1 protease family, C-terminal catalytic domain [Sesbania bispinosa]